MGKRAAVNILSMDQATKRTQSASQALLSTHTQVTIGKILSALENKVELATRVLFLIESGQLSPTKSLSGDRYVSQNKIRLLPREHMCNFMKEVCPGMAPYLHKKTICAKPTEVLSLVLYMDASSAIFSKHIETNFARMRARWTECGCILGDWRGSEEEFVQIGFYTFGDPRPATTPRKESQGRQQEEDKPEKDSGADAQLCAAEEPQLQKATQAPQQAGQPPPPPPTPTHLHFCRGQSVPLPPELLGKQWHLEDNASLSKALMVSGLSTVRCQSVFSQLKVAIEPLLKLEGVAEPMNNPHYSSAASVAGSSDHSNAAMASPAGSSNSMPRSSLSKVEQFSPRQALQDLRMPEVDGAPQL